MSEENSLESTIMQLILHSGNARSCFIESMMLARKGDFDQAFELIENAKKDLVEAHKSQTALIQAEVAGEKTELSLLMIHAQDHLMTAITLQELVTEIVYLHEKLQQVT